MTRYGVLAIGEAMVDVVSSTAPASPWPAHGHIRLRAGGTPVNVALAARSAGATAAVIATVGDDAAAAVIRTTLEAAGVAALLSVEPGGRTGVFVDLNGAIVADRGANDLLSPAALASLPDHDAIFVSGYTFRAATSVTASEALERSRARWRAVDAGGAPELPDAELANVLLGTAEELSTDPDRPEAEALRLAERYEIVVIKLGAAGAVAACGGESYRLRPAATALHGAVGAGDALDGAFLAGLAQGVGPERALAMGVDAASAAIDDLTRP
jgi:sugar/nucleoside kinase (ribokinase family)